MPKNRVHRLPEGVCAVSGIVVVLDQCSVHWSGGGVERSGMHLLSLLLTSLLQFWCGRLWTGTSGILLTVCTLGG